MMLLTERERDSTPDSREPSFGKVVEWNVRDRRAQETSSASTSKRPPREKLIVRRRTPRRRLWRIRVVRIDAQRNSNFRAGDDHPFAAMAALARIEEIDSFCARLWARTMRSRVNTRGSARSAAA